VGDLAALRALLAGWRTRGTLNARLDTEKQDTLLTWAAWQAEAVRLLLEAGASASGRRLAAALPLFSSRAMRATSSAPGLLEATLRSDKPSLPQKEFYNKTPSHDTRHGTGAHWH